ncbi:MAG: ABC transporter permease [Gammaproteobacteria bacterium]|nr:ABC transporter permease [Gammaproteobacteria bacterium]
MSVITILAMKEIRDGLRNRWIAATVLLLTSLALALYFLGSAPTGNVKASSLDVTVVSLVNLSVYLLPLIALMLSFDALVGEFERGSMLLLLTYPVSRWEIVVGKFVGHMTILLIAILIGYGGTALAIALATGSSAEHWLAYIVMMASSWLLGGVFLALGYVISSLVQERATALGAAIGVWLTAVVLYDFALMGVLLADREQAISQNLFSALLAINPTDAYRVFNLTGFESVSQVAGMANIGVKFDLDPWLLLTILGMWVVLPVTITILRFDRREL